jgi:hypothetical protein
MRSSVAGTKVSLLLGHKIDADAGGKGAKVRLATSWSPGDRRLGPNTSPLCQIDRQTKCGAFRPMVDPNNSLHEIPVAVPEEPRRMLNEK